MFDLPSVCSSPAALPLHFSQSSHKTLRSPHTLCSPSFRLSREPFPSILLPSPPLSRGIIPSPPSPYASPGSRDHSPPLLLSPLLSRETTLFHSSSPDNRPLGKKLILFAYREQVNFSSCRCCLVNNRNRMCAMRVSLICIACNACVTNLH